jgi:hypothetical protein
LACTRFNPKPPAFKEAIRIFVSPPSSWKEEIASVLERDRMRDIYDLYFLLVLRRMKHDESSTREK